jgi:dTDP-4-dehydrorhamnose reductase
MAYQNILITGAHGLLGHALTQHLKAKGATVIGAGRDTLDVLAPQADLHEHIEAWQPDLLIHAGAFTAVDQAEHEPERAMAVNAEGTRKLAAIAHDLGLVMVYISTDYVFDGTKGSPYTTTDRPNPISVYGQSKFYGELAVQELLDTYYIIRTSWLYGHGKANFVPWLLEGCRQGRPMQIVTDQFGSPTWVGSLCPLIEAIASSGTYGIYHGVDAGCVSRWEQAQVIAQAAGVSTASLTPVTTDTLGLAARRPQCSALNPSPLTVANWQTTLQSFLAEAQV